MGVYKKGQNYYIDFYMGNRRKREKIGPSKKLAETVLQKRLVEVAEGKFLDIHREKKVKLVEFIKEYLKFSETNKRPKTYELDKMATRNFSKLYENLFLNEITSLHLEKYKNARLVEVSASTVNREMDTLKNMLMMAEKWDYIHKNPAQGVRKFKEPPGRLRYLSDKEIENLLKECKLGYSRMVILTALNTGMRKGEILGLKWTDIDLENRLIHINRTKTNERRDIPINDLLLEALRQYKEQGNSERLFRYDDIKKAFHSACKRAGIENFRFHDLRHTFASHLVMGGVDLATVKDLMGHKNIAMTLRYSHLSPDHRAGAVNILAGKWTLFGHQPSECSSKVVAITKSLVA